MKYLHLSILAFLLVVTLEFFAKELAESGLTMMTLQLVNATIYVASGVLLLAFIHTTKLKSESRLILSLVVLLVVALKALGIIQAVS